MAEKPIKILLYRRPVHNENTASFNRHEAIEKMLRLSYKCKVINPNTINSPFRSKSLRTIHHLVIFYLSLTVLPFFATDRSYRYVIFLRSVKSIDAIITWIMAKPFGIRLAIERNEFPGIITSRAGSLKGWVYKKLILKWHYRLFNVIFLMTDELIDFYSPYLNKRCFVQKLPMTVDFDRFNEVTVKEENQYIFYAGSLSEKKDGVESLITSFKIVETMFPQLNLKIAGTSKNGKAENRIKSLIISLGIEKKVQMLGSVNRGIIPEYVCNSHILVLPRPDSIQARGGFPTKLGEYLASGKPVIVTRVGEIDKFLDESSVFFISPDNIINELIEKISTIMNNYNEAINIGSTGKNVAYKFFSLESNVKHLNRGMENAFKVR